MHIDRAALNRLPLPDAIRERTDPQFALQKAKGSFITLAREIFRDKTPGKIVPLYYSHPEKEHTTLWDYPRQINGIIDEQGNITVAQVATGRGRIDGPDVSTVREDSTIVLNCGNITILTEENYTWSSRSHTLQGADWETWRKTGNKPQTVEDIATQTQILREATSLIKKRQTFPDGN